MILTTEQIRTIAYGVDRCEETENGIVFHRFSHESESLYMDEVPEFNKKLLATAGVSLSFVTDSKTLMLTVDVKHGSSRTYFSHDILVNGVHIGSLKNFSDEENLTDYTAREFSLGLFSGKFFLGDGKKNVTVMFPSLVASNLVSLEIDDDAFALPVASSKTLLSLGDSITQGYDSLYPKNRYTNRVCNTLGMTEHNLAIGGEVFRPSFAKTIKNSDSIGAVIISYGSNDWFLLPYDKARENCNGFLNEIAKTFSDKTVFVLAPIWRSDYTDKKPYGDFLNVGKTIGEICDKHNNLVFVDGFDFVAHDTRLFGDGMLHPNDEGFSCFAQSFTEKIQNVRV